MCNRFVRKNRSTDLDTRTAIYRSLLIDPDSITYTLDPLAYYKRCAPKSCTWVETSKPTMLGGDGTPSILYNSLDKLGAGAGAAMILMYTVYLIINMIGRAYVYRSSAARVKSVDEHEGGGAPGAVASAGDCGGAAMARLSEEDKELRAELRAALAQLKQQLERPEGRVQAQAQVQASPRADASAPVTRAAAALTLRAEPVVAALPAGWSRQGPSSDGRFWYVNSRGESQWDPPPPLPASAPVPLAAPVQVVNRGGARANALPSGWTRAGPTAEGEYWYEGPNGESQWEPPAPVVSTAAASTRGVVSSPAASAAASPRSGALPRGWSRAGPTAEGEFWYEGPNGESQWDPPPLATSPVTQGRGGSIANSALRQSARNQLDSRRV